MTALQQVETYLAKLDGRLRFFGLSRGLAFCTLCAFALTVLLTWIGNQYRFAGGLILPLRVALFAGIAVTLVFALLRPLLRISRKNTARLAEAKVGEFGERLLTLSERREAGNPFHELVAEDTMRVAASHPPEEFVPSWWLYSAIGGAVIACVVLVWLITAAPGFWGYGASLLWTNSARATAPLYAIEVNPGNRIVRRRTDQMISAQLKGFSAQNVILHAKYHDALKWDQIPMQAQPSANGYQILFAGLSDSLEYFVEAAGSQSQHYTLAVKDLPAVMHLRVAVHFPAAIHLPDAVDDPGGDIRAIQGSKAEVRVLTDKPLEHGILVTDDGARIPLVADKDNWFTATLPIQTDGGYHLAALDGNEAVRLTDNYIIEARQDEPPTVSIVRPGKDAGVSPIEELPVAVKSTDDFGIHGLELHYSVNGGPEQVKSLGGNENAKSADGKTVLPLEDYKLSPGDLVSFYATAKDATHTSRSDIVFAKVEPFDLKFRQSQSSGGGGDGAGDDNSKISERQKEIIAATWNQVKDPAKEAAGIAQNSQFLSELESKLGEQAKALSERMSNRELGQDSTQFKEFSKSMIEASGEMSQAVGQLRTGKFNNALGPEQKGLQSLMHAESLFRDIQVSMSQKNGGGAAGGGQERELSRLFDLELDTAKNQYESAQSGSKSPQQDMEKKLNEELERLKELARRQQQLADEQHSPQQQFQQRWEEEQLRREAEQLRQQIEQQQQSNSQSASSSSSSASSQASSSTQSSGANRQQAQKANARSPQTASQREAMRKALQALSKAEDEMRAAASKGDAGAQQRSAQQLAEAQNALRDMLHQQASGELGNLAEKAQQLAASQGDLARRIKRQYGADSVNMARTDENGKPQMPAMNGPGYGGWYRRAPEMPNGTATAEERALAEENEKLAEQVQQLQDQMQAQAQALAPQQPDTTRKLRKALSDAEQEEIAVRMRKSSEWLKNGFGSRTWPTEDSITAATRHLSQQLEEARKAGENSQAAANKDEDGSGLGQAMAQVQSMREQLQRAEAQARKGQNSSAQSPGSRSRQNGSQSDTASSGAAASASGSAGSPDATGGMYGLDGQQMSAEDQLAGMRARLGRNDRQLNNYLSEAMAAVRPMDGRAGLLDARLTSNAMLSLERLELELSRRMGQKAGARTNAPEDVPEGYRDAVATYFRMLSK